MKDRFLKTKDSRDSRIYVQGIVVPTKPVDVGLLGIRVLRDDKVWDPR
jgi:hypothetical protein